MYVARLSPRPPISLPTCGLTAAKNRLAAQSVRNASLRVRRWPHIYAHTPENARIGATTAANVLLIPPPSPSTRGSTVGKSRIVARSVTWVSHSPGIFTATWKLTTINKARYRVLPFNPMLYPFYFMWRVPIHLSSTFLFLSTPFYYNFFNFPNHLPPCLIIVVWFPPALSTNSITSPHFTLFHFCLVLVPLSL